MQILLLFLRVIVANNLARVYAMCRQAIINLQRNNNISSIYHIHTATIALCTLDILMLVHRKMFYRKLVSIHFDL